jgi:hypothetical protein
VKMAFSSMKVMIYGPLIIAKTTTSAWNRAKGQYSYSRIDYTVKWHVEYYSYTRWRRKSIPEYHTMYLGSLSHNVFFRRGKCRVGPLACGLGVSWHAWGSLTLRTLK